MGLFDELRKLTRPYDDDDEFEEDYEPRAQERIPAPQPVTQHPRSSVHTPTRASSFDLDERRPDRSNKVVNIHATTQLQVILVKPDKFENAAEIADHLRDKRTVVLNLESTNKDVARRLIDFLSGVAYAQDGKIKKVAVSTYIITPYNVDIMGDLIDELENNGLYF